MFAIAYPIIFIIGCFIGTLISSFLYRVFIKMAIVRWVKQQEQHLAVISRYRHQVLDALLKDALNNVKIGGIRVPAADLLANNFPDTWKVMRKIARNNPDALMRVLGSMLIPMLEGAAQSQIQAGGSSSIMPDLINMAGQALGGKNDIPPGSI